MSKIFKALEQAQREKRQAESGFQGSGAAIDAFGTDLGRSERIRDAALVDLCRAVDAELPGSNKTVLFISAQSGEGVSFIAAHFARVCAKVLGKQVQVIQALSDTGKPGGSALERDAQKIQDICRAISEPGTAPEPLHAGRPVSLSLKSCVTGFKRGEGVTNLKGHFDILIIDAPPLETDPLGVELARYADGVVIVLEAEKTKAFAAENLKEKILLHSGNILGVVLNKRCFHIPDYLYGWLH